MSDMLRSYKMENIREIEVETAAGIETHVIIDRGNGEFTSCLKETYDKMVADAANRTVNPL